MTAGITVFTVYLTVATTGGSVGSPRLKLIARTCNSQSQNLHGVKERASAWLEYKLHYASYVDEFKGRQRMLWASSAAW
jgi:hypothetical protein